MTGGSPPALSATVLLLRDSHAGLEVFMIRRARTLSVWPGYLAFPGGVLEAKDVEAVGAGPEPGVFFPPAPPHFSPAGAEWRGERLGRERLFRSLIFAGFRELEEETGIVFPAQGGPGALRYLGHRVTPREYPRRFDAHYFAVRAPSEVNEAVRQGQGEVEECLWTSPAQAACLHAERSWLIAPPTLDALRALSPWPDVETALRGSRLTEREEGSDSRDLPSA